MVDNAKAFARQTVAHQILGVCLKNGIAADPAAITVVAFLVYRTRKAFANFFDGDEEGAYVPTWFRLRGASCCASEPTQQTCVCSARGGVSHATTLSVCATPLHAAPLALTPAVRELMHMCRANDADTDGSDEERFKTTSFYDSETGELVGSG